MRLHLLALVCLFAATSATALNATTKANAPRIVTLKGAYTEALVLLGMAEHIVGVDATSTFPPTLADVPRVGHIRNLSAEGVLSLAPTIIVIDPNEINKSTMDQLSSAGAEMLSVPHEFSPEGTKRMIRVLAERFDSDASLVDKLCGDIDQNLSKVTTSDGNAPRVLFIYARGAGTMMVAGEGTQMETMINLAGGVNAAQGFSHFRPLNAEAMVVANPDVVLMFDSGVKALGGPDAIWNMPGILQTNAGKHKRVVTMDGQYLSGFGPRLGAAVLDLNRQLFPVTNESRASR